MRPLLCIFFITVALPVWGGGIDDTCRYAGAFESIRLNVDYDVFGASDLCLNTLFQSEGGEDLGIIDERARLHTCMDIKDSQLGQFIPISKGELFPFEKGLGKIKVSALVDEKDFAFPRFRNYPMVQSKLIDPDKLEWGSSEREGYNESSSIMVSNKNIDFKLTLYRWCY